MKYLLAILLTLAISDKSFSQLYGNYRSNVIYFVQVTCDSARVEAFYNSYPDFDFKAISCLLPVFVDKKLNNIADYQDIVILKNNTYYLKLHQTKSGKFFKMRLKPYENKSDELEALRKSSYSTSKRIECGRLYDSLIGKNYLDISINNSFRAIDSKGNDYNKYVYLTDSVCNVIQNQIFAHANPIAVEYNQKCDSIQHLEECELNRLIENADYELRSSNYFLQQLALKRPRDLVNYIALNSAKRKTVLKAIRNHNDYKEMITNIKRSTTKSDARKAILRQKNMRELTDASIATAYFTIILAEIAGFVGFGFLIF